MAITLKICSFSGLRSSLDRGISASMDLYRRYVGFLPAGKRSAMLSQSKHWSSSCQVCRTCSAALVLYTCTIFNKSSTCYSIEVLSRELVCHAITEDTTSCSKMLQLLKCAGTPCYSSDLYINPSAANHSLHLQVKLPIVSVHFTFQ